MEYNNYYPAQGHPASNSVVGGPNLMQQQQPPHPPGSQMMHHHASMGPQNIRQAMPPGPISHHLQMQQQHLSHHQQQMPPQQQQQQQYPNYHQIQPSHPHAGQPQQVGPPQQQQTIHHNHQSTLVGPPNQPSPIPPQHQHHLHHPQSPRHLAGPPMHMQQQQPPPPLPPQQQQQQQQHLNNQLGRPPMGSTVVNHPHPGPPHHHQNFFAGGSVQSQPNLQHYPQQNHHHQHQQHPHIQQHPHQHHHHHHPQQQQQQQQPTPIHHGSLMGPHHPHNHMSIGRNSPHFSGILQTEFRIIEFNRRLQCRPINRYPITPLPTNNIYDESIWWERFATEFFEDDATLTIRIQDDKPVDYTIGRTLIPRFFRTYFDGGVTDLSINLRNPKETSLYPHTLTLECDQAFIVTNNIFRHPAINATQGIVVHTEGRLVIDFSTSLEALSIRSWRFCTKGCREYIDRAMTAMGLPNSFLADPATRQGLTKSTVSYLKMCMIMEPMQDLMFQHRQTKMDPRSCLRKLLLDRYKYRSGDENRVATSKRRKRKPSAAPSITGPATTKKSKANSNNSLVNSGLNNNIMMSPFGNSNFSLASQDVMIVGEPSMMGGDFGDDNERMITRLENAQYNPSASAPLNTKDPMNRTTPTGNDNMMTNNTDSCPSPSVMQAQQLLQQHPQHQVPAPIQQQHIMTHHSPIDQASATAQNHHQQQQVLPNVQDHLRENSIGETIKQASIMEHNELLPPPRKQQHEEMNMMLQQQIPVDDQQQQQQPQQVQVDFDQISEEDLIREESTQQQHDIEETTTRTIDSIGDATNDSNLILGVNSIEQMENHTNSIQPLNEESNSNLQLPCSTVSTSPAIEQQQPVDNGVA